MKILSINIGTARKILARKEEQITGIYKQPVSGLVEVTPLGLPDDLIADTKHHGGPDQALYLYGQPDYDWWSAELGRPLAPGSFGDNLTIGGLESAKFMIGDMLHIGAVTLQVTAPRIPCATLAARMEDPQFVKKFKIAERPGLYCRVLQTGSISAGETVKFEPYQGETLSILDVYRDHYNPDNSPAGLRRFLAAPIDARTRQEKQKRLTASIK